MKLTFLILTITNARLIKSTKYDDTRGVLLYEELGCKLEKSRCPFKPTKYVCPKYRFAKGICITKEGRYQDGEIINETSRCTSCYCSAPQSRVGKIICSRPRCSHLVIKNPCWEHYDLDDCCPKKSFCPHALMHTCNVDNIIYNEGQYLRPKNTCWECVCEKGFASNIRKFCRRIRCDLEINHYQKLADRCIPLYKNSRKDKALCCPKDFICADEVSSLEMAEKSILEQFKKFLLKLFRLAEYCEFGDNNIIVGDEFKLNLQDTKFRRIFCTCLIPPFPICIED